MQRLSNGHNKIVSMLTKRNDLNLKEGILVIEVVLNFEHATKEKQQMF